MTVKNAYKVNSRKWKRWSKTSRYVFNTLYSTMKNNQELFLHPKSSILSNKLWKTTSWNAAWIAADAVGDVS